MDRQHLYSWSFVVGHNLLSHSSVAYHPKNCNYRYLEEGTRPHNCNRKSRLGSNPLSRNARSHLVHLRQYYNILANYCCWLQSIAARHIFLLLSFFYELLWVLIHVWCPFNDLSRACHLLLLKIIFWRNVIAQRRNKTCWNPEAGCKDLRYGVLVWNF